MPKQRLTVHRLANAKSSAIQSLGENPARHDVLKGSKASTLHTLVGLGERACYPTRKLFSISSACIHEGTGI